jgi:hypothetical protein
MRERLKGFCKLSAERFGGKRIKLIKRRSKVMVDTNLNV